MSSLGLLVKKDKLWIEIFYTSEGYYTSHGQGSYDDNGRFVKNEKSVTTDITISQPKNVGKKNATTQSEQAIKEAQALYDKKIKDGYNEGHVDNTLRFEPMLCANFDSDVMSSDSDVYFQPKIDGVRMITKLSDPIECFSRNGNDFVSVRDKLSPVLSHRLAPNLTVYLDGEIVSKTGYLEDSISVVRGTSDELEYILYDMYVEEIPEIPYTERKRQLEILMSRINTSYIRLIDTKNGKFNESDSELQKMIDKGYEGLIIRNPTSSYQCGKRSKVVLKYKKKFTSEYTILEITEGEGSRKGLASSARFEDNGIEFYAGIKFDNSTCRDMYQNRERLIGKLATVEYLDRTKYNVPKFAKFVAIRDYE